MRGKVWLGSAIALAGIAGAAYLALGGNKVEVKWRTARVERGSVTQRVTATGAVNALIQVPVGAQVSGQVVGIYVDFNSLVRKGQVIARIDPKVFEDALCTAQATLAQDEANQLLAQATYRRDLQLWKEKILDDADLDTASNALKVAEQSVASAQASVSTARTNLGYCTIKAPVDGVVVSRLVDVGQTVASSYATPSLFSIAQDLSRMKVFASVDEADVGQVRVGQRAFFTVESYPDRQFQGRVSEVQLNPTVTNNVVTYNVVMAVDNEPRNAYLPAPKAADPAAPAAAGRSAPAALEYTTARYMPPGSPVYRGTYALFPGMTADCTVVTNRREGVLRVPSAALRFNPAAFVTMDKPAGAQGDSHPHPAGAAPAHGMVAQSEDRLWVLDHGRPRAIPVRAGISDGTFTEVSGPGIVPGLVVLVGVEELRKGGSPNGAPLGAHPGPGFRH